MVKKESPRKRRRCWYRPEQERCATCQGPLKRSHLLWHKQVIGLQGAVEVGSWGYRCANPDCSSAARVYASQEAEALHLKHRRYSRELVVHIGYRRFWQCQTIYELHAWLTKALGVPISERQVLNLIGDFLALLQAAQPVKIRECLQGLKSLIIGLDGLQPEKGNTCLYVVRELQTGVTLLAESLDESSAPTLSRRLFEPLKALAQEVGLPWHGVVSDAQETIRLAVATSLPGIPHQVCHFHCLRTAGDLTFQADRKMKKQLKSVLRERVSRVQSRIERLSPGDPYRPVLVDYVEALRATLLSGGIAPFELGGVWIFDALTDLATSLVNCQKNKRIPSCSAY